MNIVSKGVSSIGVFLLACLLVLAKIVQSIGAFVLACLLMIALLVLAAHLPSCVREYPGMPSVYPSKPPVDEAEFTAENRT